MDKRSILIFGVGPLQRSLIQRCKLKGFFTVGIDPMANASCKNDVDAFEVVDGQDFEKTLEIAEHYNVQGIITAATDKPLVMMACVAIHLKLPFLSIEAATWSTDKLFMKQKFMEAEIPCAKGFLISNVIELVGEKFSFPVIVKPRDNSGSRGVMYCKNLKDVDQAIQEATQYTKKENVLIEEFIEGKEYSVEGLHIKGESHVIQITEKITTAFPYNVELGHIQPAELSADLQKEIKMLVSNTAKALEFTDCASHTEIKINQKGIFVIESSPRLGGDHISSALVPLSTGVFMEDLLIDIAIGANLEPNFYNPTLNKFAAIIYFELPEGTIITNPILEKLEEIKEFKEVQDLEFILKKGDLVKRITNSMNRYGYAVFQTDTSEKLKKCMEKLNKVNH